MNKRTALKTSFIAMVIFTVAAGVGAWRWSSREPMLSYTTAVVKRGDLVATISSTGTIEPVEVVDVGAQVAGRIITFGTDTAGKPIDYGSVVEEGAILAKIDEAVYAADLAVARAQMEQDKAKELIAQANLEQAKALLVQTDADLKRATELTHSSAMPVSTFDSRKASYEVSKAGVAVAEAAVIQTRASSMEGQAALERAQRNLDFCTIKSPVTGVIIDRRVNIGQTVVSSLNAPSLFLIARDLTKMQIWVGVNEADVGRIVPGGMVTFTCDAFPGREFRGVVGKVRLNATMTQNVVMYTVEVDTENRDNILLPYLTANVRFILSHESKVLIVPNAALRWTPSNLEQIAPDARAAASEAAGSDERGATGQTPENKPGKGRGAIWVKDGKYVRSMEVNLGTSDGANTAVAADSLREGQVVVTGEIVAAAHPDAKNPFLPKATRR